MSRDRARVAVWLPGVLVGIGAAVATAHGLFEVARAAGSPGAIAGLYPLITDGLALVAYAATTRLSGTGRAYAWVVVVLAAGLSGLAQASYMADATPSPAAAGAQAVPLGMVHAAVPAALRFGVGAWPAVAAAIVAHLLFLLATNDRAEEPDPAVDHVTDGAKSDAPHNASVVQPAPLYSETVQPVAVQSGSEHPPAVQPGPVQLNTERDNESSTNERQRSTRGPSTPDRRSGKPGERARQAAEAHYAEHGVLPTVTALQGRAQVSRGTAGEAIKALRPRPAGLHIVPLNDESSRHS
jgi:hypothetical protein